MSLNDPTLIIYFSSNDAIARECAQHFIEEGQWFDLKHGWTARSDNPHVNGMRQHTHLLFKGAKVAVINDDGSPSHGSDLSRIPARIIRELRTRRLIEKAGAEDFASGWWSPVPLVVIREAVERIESMRRLRALLRSGR